jgi:hypothetical protein
VRGGIPRLGSQDAGMQTVPMEGRVKTRIGPPNLVEHAVIRRYWRSLAYTALSVLNFLVDTSSCQPTALQID